MRNSHNLLLCVALVLFVFGGIFGFGAFGVDVSLARSLTFDSLGLAAFTAAGV